MKKNFPHIILLLPGILFFNFSYAQKHKIDSLVNYLNQTLEDTSRMISLNRLSQEYNSDGDYEKAIAAAEKAKTFSEKIVNDKTDEQVKKIITRESGLASNNIGVAFKNQGNFPKALEYYFEGLKLFEQIDADFPGDSKIKSGIAGCYSNIGNIYSNQELYSKGLEYQLQALKIAQDIHDKTSEARYMNNVGVAYDNMGEYVKALNYFQQSLDIKEEILKVAEQNGNSREIKETKKSVSYSMNNIGNIYTHRGDSAKSIGNILLIGDNYAKALDYYFQAVKLREEVNDHRGKAISLGNIGDVYSGEADSAAMAGNERFAFAKYKTALLYHMQVLDIATEMGTLDLQRDACDAIYGHYEKLKQTDSAFAYYKKYISLRDTLFNAENTRKTVEAEMNFSFEKKTAVEKAEQEKKDSINAEKLAAEKRQRNYFIAGFGMMIILSGFIFRSYRQKKKANEIIAEQKIIVEQKQKEVLDSIEYAKRIQQSLLPTEKYIDKNLDRLKRK